VKHGWFAFVVFMGLAVWITHSRTESGIDAKISGITNYFNGQISNLTGQLADARHDRDHYQEMLAPFEAFAIAKYTNAPIDQRLDLLFADLSAITNALQQMESKEINLSLMINDQTNLASSPYSPEGTWSPNNIITLSKTKEIRLTIMNGSEYSADRPSITFTVPIDSMYISAPGWEPYPKDLAGYSVWRLSLNDYLMSFNMLPETPMFVLPTFTGTNIAALIEISSANSKSSYYTVNFLMPH
jgi:hypothetical protein